MKNHTDQGAGTGNTAGATGAARFGDLALRTANAIARVVGAPSAITPGTPTPTRWAMTRALERAMRPGQEGGPEVRFQTNIIGTSIRVRAPGIAGAGAMTALIFEDGTVTLVLDHREGADFSTVWVPVAERDSEELGELWADNRLRPGDVDLPRLRDVLRALQPVSPHAALVSAWVEHEVLSPGQVKPLEWLTQQG